MDNIEKEPLSQPIVTGPAVETTSPKPKTIPTIPSQADLFRREGVSLGVGTRKGDIHLDAIVRYVERMANLDDLSDVWNRLTEMGVDNNIKKRWINLYAQSLPGKEIPSELKEKLETGQEPRK